MTKISLDIPTEELEKIDEASKLDRRTRSSFIRHSALTYAEKILQNKENVTS